MRTLLPTLHEIFFSLVTLHKTMTTQTLFLNKKTWRMSFQCGNLCIPLTKSLIIITNHHKYSYISVVTLFGTVVVLELCLWCVIYVISFKLLFSFPLVFCVSQFILAVDQGLELRFLPSIKNTPLPLHTLFDLTYLTEYFYF